MTFTRQKGTGFHFNDRVKDMKYVKLVNFLRMQWCLLRPFFHEQTFHWFSTLCPGVGFSCKYPNITLTCCLQLRVWWSLFFIRREDCVLRHVYILSFESWTWAVFRTYERLFKTVFLNLLVLVHALVITKPFEILIGMS